MTTSPTPLAFFKGEYVPLKDANVNIATHALHYGTSAFEGIRGNWNAEQQTLFIFRMREHYERLIRSSNALHIKVKYTPQELCDITTELIRRAGFKQDLYIRPVAYKSTEAVAQLNLAKLTNDLFIMAVPFGNYVGSDGGPINCVTSDWRKPRDNSIPPGTKIAALYTPNVLAKTDAIGRGYDEAIMLNSHDTVSEGSGENLFLISNGKLYTPPPTADCLIGITRATIIQIAREVCGLEVTEREIQHNELSTADEIFLTGTAAHVTPVGSIDDRPIADGKTGPITTQIVSLYFNLIFGRNDERLTKEQRENYQDWLTAVTWE